jgi:hypothetical protein
LNPKLGSTIELEYRGSTWNPDQVT